MKYEVCSRGKMVGLRPDRKPLKRLTVAEELRKSTPRAVGWTSPELRRFGHCAELFEDFLSQIQRPSEQLVLDLNEPNTS